MYGAAVLFASILGGHACLGDVYQSMMGSPPSVMDYAGMYEFTDKLKVVIKHLLSFIITEFVLISVA